MFTISLREGIGQRWWRRLGECVGRKWYDGWDLLRLRGFGERGRRARWGELIQQFELEHPGWFLLWRWDGKVIRFSKGFTLPEGRELDGRFRLIGVRLWLLRLVLPCKDDPAGGAEFHYDSVMESATVIGDHDETVEEIPSEHNVR
ncbi:MAG: hypothetical protein Fur0034_11420 [Desulfuromonadia bacterium]